MDDITINIAVGPSAASFVIHKKLLIQYSGYFTNMLKDKETHGYDFPEGRTKTCVMAEASADAFSYVQEWIYRQDIEQVGDITSAPGTEGAEKCSPSAVMYADIYRLADYLNRPELQDFVMTRLYKAFDQLGGKKYQMGHLIKPCCEDTVQGYAPKRWISALFALGVGVMSYKKAEELTCQDFLFETFRLRQADVQKQDIPPGSVHVKELPHLYYYDLGRYLFKKPKSVAQKNLDADAQEAQGKSITL